MSIDLVKLVLAVVTNILLTSFFLSSRSTHLALISLLAGYFVSSVIIYYLKCKKNLMVNRQYIYYPILWGSIIGIIIVFFYKNYLYFNVSDLILAQAISPTVGLILSKDLFRQNDSIKSKLMQSTPLIILVLICIEKGLTFHNSTYQNLSTLIILFSMGQFFLRKVAGKLDTFYSISIGGMSTSFVLLFYLITQNTKGYRLNIDSNLYLFLIVIVTIISVFIIQVGYVDGVKKLDPMFSNIIISSALPISFIISFVSMKDISVSLIGLSLLYVIMTYISNVKKRS